MKRHVIAAIAVLAASCATTAGYEKMLSSFVGLEEIELVRRWGPPLQTYETGGRRFLSYQSDRTIYRAGTPGIVHTTVIGTTAYSRVLGGVPGSWSRWLCQTVFELDGTKVVAWSHQGNDCRAEEK